LVSPCFEALPLEREEVTLRDAVLAFFRPQWLNLKLTVA
jgi:hypothetical protein